MFRYFFPHVLVAIAMTLHHIIFDLIPFANTFTTCSACAFACFCLFPLANHL